MSEDVREFPKDEWTRPGDMIIPTRRGPFNWSAYVRLLKWEHEVHHSKRPSPACIRCATEKDVKP